MLIELYIAIIVLMLLAIFTAISIWIMCSITRWFPEIKNRRGRYETQ